MSDTIVTTPPDVVRILASSTVFVKASSFVNLDFGAIAAVMEDEAFRPDSGADAAGQILGSSEN